MQIPGYDLKSHHGRFLSHAFPVRPVGHRQQVTWTANKNCAVLRHYAARSGNFLPKFRVNLSAPWPLNMVVPKRR